MPLSGTEARSSRVGVSMRSGSQSSYIAAYQPMAESRVPSSLTTRPSRSNMASTKRSWARMMYSLVIG